MEFQEPPQPSRRRFLTSSAKMLGGAVAASAFGDTLLSPRTAAAAPAVPWAYLALANELNQRIDADSLLLQLGQPAPAVQTVYGAHLFTADANRVQKLLDPWTIVGCFAQLDALQAIGVNAVTVSVSYPLLDWRFPNFNKYLDFYVAVANEIRRRGMTLTVQTALVLSDPSYNTDVDYRGHTVDGYFAARTSHVQTIAKYMAPNFLSFANEPSVEQHQLGLSFDPARYTRFINETLEKVPRGNIQYCGGAGSWDDLAYWNSFMSNTTLDNGDLHLYPLATTTTDYILQSAAMVDVARVFGKGVIVTECGLYKAGAQEVGGRLPAPQVFARDIYDFWQPLDVKYLYLMKLFSQRKGIKYLSFFWSKYLHQAYLPYTWETSNYGYAQGQLVTEAVAANSIAAKTVSETGVAYSLIARGL